MLHNISIFDHINAALVSKIYFFLKQKILPQRFEYCKCIWTALVTVLTPLKYLFLIGYLWYSVVIPN